MKQTYLLIALLLLGCASPPRKATKAIAGLKIITHSQALEEKDTVQSLKQLLLAHRLDNYYFSQTVLVAKGAPSSVDGPGRPIILTDAAKNPNLLLLEFFRAQLRYHLLNAKYQNMGEVQQPLHELLPKLPHQAFSGLTASEQDLYRDLVVDYLAFRALRKLFGEKSARNILLSSAGNAVLHETAIEQDPFLENLLAKYQLIPEE